MADTSPKLEDEGEKILSENSEQGSRFGAYLVREGEDRAVKKKKKKKAPGN